MAELSKGTKVYGPSSGDGYTVLASAVIKGERKYWTLVDGTGGTYTVDDSIEGWPRRKPFFEDGELYRHKMYGKAEVIALTEYMGKPIATVKWELHGFEAIEEMTDDWEKI